MHHLLRSYDSGNVHALLNCDSDFARCCAATETEYGALYESCDPTPFDHERIPALADEGASGLYVPGNFGFGAGVTPDPGMYLSSGFIYYDGAIKVYIEGGKIVLDVDKRPFSAGFAALWVPETKILGGQIGLSLGSSYSFAWAHGEVTGLINAEKKVEGWGLGSLSHVRRSVGHRGLGQTRFT